VANAKALSHLSSGDGLTPPSRATNARQVNTVLGSLVRLHYPGVVPVQDLSLLVLLRRGMITLATDINYENAQGVVWNDF
jgi:hypothetical protein